MNDLNSEYQHYGVATKYDSTYAAGQGWESLDGEVACGTSASPYMIDCSGYDSQKTWLTYFYGTVNARKTGTLFYQTALKNTGTNYYVIGTCP